nr:hypothetical protein BaRGS_009593 [Batillaria attramentaria]
MEKLLAAIHCCVCFSLLTFRARAYPEVQLLDGHAQTDQRLLLILLDGFRWDYLDRGGVSLPGFRKVVQRGAKPEYLIPDFPTTSYPNYYSIMTGLHTESHGMTGNYMYDVNRKESFIIGTNHEQFNAHWWNGADPLWTAAVRQNKTVYMYHWPGCEVTIHGLTPTYCLKYTSIPSMDNFRTAITQSLAQLQFQEADVAAIYFELTDSLGHNYGPLSDELMQLLSDLDPIMEYLADSLATYSLSDVNLMIFSDHGMTEVSRSRVINLSDVIQWDDYDAIMDAGALVSIYTKPDTEDKV